MFRTTSSRPDQQRESGETKKPRILTPRTEPNLKSTTLYPAERAMGMYINERKKSKESISKN